MMNNKHLQHTLQHVLQHMVQQIHQTHVDKQTNKRHYIVFH